MSDQHTNETRELDLTLPRQALMDHRGPRFVTRETEVGTDGKTHPVAWTAHCRCGVVTDAYEDHLLEMISLAAIVSATGRRMADMLADTATPPE